MNYKFSLLLLIIIFVCLFTAGVEASIFDWNAYETDQFIIFYPDGFKYQAEEVLYYLNKYQQQTMDLVGNEREFKTLVVLRDGGLRSSGFSNAAATEINLYTNSPSTFTPFAGAEGYNNWFRQVTIHEFTHLAQMKNASGMMGWMSKWGGSIYSPNLYQPRWIKEGIAIVNESRFKEQEGRLNNGYYDSFIASRVKNSQLPSLKELAYNPQNEYIYGGSFLDYLAAEYGEDKFSRYFAEHSDNYLASIGMLFPAVGIDKTAEKVYGKSFPKLFSDWKAKVKKENQGWSTPGQKVVANSRGKISNLTFYEDKLYYITRKNFRPAPFTKEIKYFLVEYNLESKEKRILTELSSDSWGTLQLINNKVYYATKQKGYGMLHSYNLDTDQKKKILADTFNDFAVLKTGKIIIYVKDRQGNYGSEIWKYNPHTHDREKLGSVEQLISEIKFHAGNFIVVSKQQLGSWNINQLKIIDTKGENKPSPLKPLVGEEYEELVEDEQESSEYDELFRQTKLSLKPLINSSDIEKFIKISKDKVYFTANYDELHAVYSYDLTNKKLIKLTPGSYAVDGVRADNYLYFVGMSNSGEAIYKIEGAEQEYSLPPAEEVGALNSNLLAQAEKKNVFIENFSYLLTPYVRFPYLEGKDILGKTSYRVNYLNNFNSTLLRKVSLGDRSALGVNNFDSESGRRTSIQFTYQANPWRSKVIYAPDAYYLQGGWKRDSSMLDNSLNLMGDIFIGSSQTESRLKIAEEYSAYSDVKGSRLRLELVHKLLTCKVGLWNPNLFLGRVYGNAFGEFYYAYADRVEGDYDPYYPYDNNPYQKETKIGDLVYGYEVLFEVLAGFNYPVVPSLGCKVYHSERKIKPYFKFNLNF